MIKRCKVRSVSKFNGLLVDDDKTWYNPTKAASPYLPDLKQFVGREVNLHLVDGKDHTYSGISLIESTGGKQEAEVAKDSILSSNPTTDNVRLLALICASLMFEPGCRMECYTERAEEIMKWVRQE